MTITATLYKRDFSVLLGLPQSLALSVKKYGKEAQGGPLDAELEAQGTIQDLWRCQEWLRCPVEFEDDETGKVWWGYVAEVQLAIGRWTVGVSLDTMTNRIAIKYSKPRITGGGASTTTWLQDDDSVAAYGTKELLMTMSDITEVAATARQTKELAQKKYPIRISKKGGGGGPAKATIHCRGWIETTKWQYYDQSAGYESHEPSSTSASYKIGLGLTAATIAFRAGTKKIHDIESRLTNFKSGDRVVVSGSTSNNSTFTVAGGASGDPISYTNTTLNFSSGVQINDTAAQLGQFAVGDMIQISGSVSNDGYYTINTVGNAGTHVIVDQALVNGPAGPSITIERGHAITVEETLTNEMPGASVTIQMESAKIAQSFAIPVGITPWTIDSVQVRIRKVGTPIDSVAFGLRSDSAGVPGTLIDVGSLLPADISSSYEWRPVEDMDNLVTMDGTTYWLAIGRVGAIDPDNYYEIAVDSEAEYTRGQLKVLVGASYVDPPEPYDIPFKIIGAWETTYQIQQIVSAACPFLAGVDIIDASGISTPQHRDGNATAHQEMMDLLELGASDGSRLLATVTKERYLRIYKEPAPGVEDWIVDVDDVLRDDWNSVVNPARCPVGFWMKLDIIPASANSARLASASPVFVERSEYIVESRELVKEQKGVPSKWDVGTVRQG